MVDGSRGRREGVCQGLSAALSHWQMSVFQNKTQLRGTPSIHSKSKIRPKAHTSAMWADCITAEALEVTGRGHDIRSWVNHSRGDHRTGSQEGWRTYFWDVLPPLCFDSASEWGEGGLGGRGTTLRQGLCPCSSKCGGRDGPANQKTTPNRTYSKHLCWKWVKNTHTNTNNFQENCLEEGTAMIECSWNSLHLTVAKHHDSALFATETNELLNDI